MSKSLPSPWIYKDLYDILNSNGNENVINTPVSRLTVVISVYNSFNCIVINDTKHYITVMLTTSCVNKIIENYGSLDIIKNSLINLESYHYSTVLQVASNRDLADMCRGKAKISLPLTINCNSLSFIGNSGLTLIHDSIDINHDNRINVLLNKLGYIKLVNKLVKHQFMNKSHLPDADYNFTIPEETFNDENIATLDDFYISKDEAAHIDNLASYDHSYIIKQSENLHKTATNHEHIKLTDTIEYLDTLVDDDTENLYFTNESSSSAAMNFSQKMSKNNQIYEETQFDSLDNNELIVGNTVVVSNTIQSDDQLTQTDSIEQDIITKSTQVETQIDSPIKIQGEQYTLTQQDPVLHSYSTSTPLKYFKDSIKSPSKSLNSKSSNIKKNNLLPSNDLIGRFIKRHFITYGDCFGLLTNIYKQCYVVTYEDGYEESIHIDDINHYLIDSNDRNYNNQLRKLRETITRLKANDNNNTIRNGHKGKRKSGNILNNESYQTPNKSNKETNNKIPESNLSENFVTSADKSNKKLKYKDSIIEMIINNLNNDFGKK